MKRLGKLKEILSQLIQLEKNSETAKDGRVIYWEGELAEGTALYVLDEEGNEVACPDGEVIIEDKKIVVADGKVSTIETVAAEEPKVEEPQPTDEPKETDMSVNDKANKFSAVVDFYSMSYDERWQLLYKAAEELYPDKFLYVEDAGDDYAVICLYDDDENKLYKYSVAWEGENNDVPTLSNPVEVKRGYIPVNEEIEPATETPAEPVNEPATETSAMAEQMAELEALRTEVEELRAKLAQPAKMSEQKRLEEMESNENLTDKYAAIAAALRKR